MSEPFIGEVRMWACSYAPRDWAICNGAEMQISQFTTLFSILSTTYGGNGRTTFALPNLTDRAPMHPGQGPGLSYRRLGELSGVIGVELDASENPSHNHIVYGASEKGNAASPSGITFLGQDSGNRSEISNYLSTSQTVDSSLVGNTLTATGKGQVHENRQPLLGVNFCIALDGIYPTRN